MLFFAKEIRGLQELFPYTKSPLEQDFEQFELEAIYNSLGVLQKRSNAYLSMTEMLWF
jgi:hypothetical protein